MRLSFFILLTLFLSNTLQAQNLFKELSFEQAIDSLNDKKPLVLIYFSAGWSEACTEFENETLQNAFQEGLLKNEIIVKPDANKNESLRNSYEVNRIPAVVWVNKNKELVHKAEGNFGIEEFRKIRNQAFSPNENLKALKERYNSWDRSAAFLRTYLYTLLKSGTMDSEVLNEYLRYVNGERMLEPESLKSIVDFSIFRLNIYLPFESDPVQTLVKNRPKAKKAAGMNKTDAVIAYLALDAASRGLEKKDSSLFYSARNVLNLYNARSNLFLEDVSGEQIRSVDTKMAAYWFDMAYGAKTGDEDLFNQATNLYYEYLKTKPDKLEDLLWYYAREGYSEFVYDKAITLSSELLENKTTYSTKDLQANLYFQKGDYEKALVAAEEAIRIAKQNGISYFPTSKLKEDISKKTANED